MSKLDAVSIRLVVSGDHQRTIQIIEEVKRFNIWIEEYEHVIKPCSLCNGNKYDLILEPVEICIFNSGGLVTGNNGGLFVFHILTCCKCGNANIISRKSIVGYETIRYNEV